MDKINVLLISIICILVGINIYIILDTCFGFGSKPFAEGELAHEYGCIAMNDDGQAVNGSSEDMWFRARIADSAFESNGGGSEDSSSEDGWVYIDKAVSPGAMSETFLPYFQTGESNDIAGNEEKNQVIYGTASVYPEGVLLEGICTNWVSKDIKNAEEAFATYKMKPLRHYKSSSI